MKYRFSRTLVFSIKRLREPEMYKNVSDTKKSYMEEKRLITENMTKIPAYELTHCKFGSHSHQHWEDCLAALYFPVFFFSFNGRGSRITK